MAPVRPSLALLRTLSDEHVLRALLADPRLTRAEIAGRTGLSKPTVSESVRRLEAAGLLRDTGERTSGRGGVGSYYALAEGLGTALVSSIAPEGVVAELLDVRGDVIRREVTQVGRPARPAEVDRALRTVAVAVLEATPGPVRLAVVSAADPVDRATGRLVHLPDAPFLVGELSPMDVLAPVVAGPVVVDNDVHWAARAERSAAAAGELDDFVHVHLGEGLGAAVVADGEVRRGHGGIAGEIAHVLTRGPGGRAVRFTEVFAELGLRRPGSTAVDVVALRAALDDPGTRAVVADAVCGVLEALVSLVDPRVVVLGGEWGAEPTVLAAISRSFERLPRHVPVRPAQVTVDPSLTGARIKAVADLQAAILAQPGDGARGTG